MMKYQHREFRRLAWNVVLRLWKLDGHLRWLMERTDFGTPLSGEDVDAFYERWYNLEDALVALKGCELWRSVDVDFDDPVED